MTIMPIRKLNKKDYKIGQEVILEFNGNALRGKQEFSYTKGIIEKIGTKLLTVSINEYRSVKINVKTSYEHTQYTHNYILHDSKQQFEECLESIVLLKRIRNTIGGYGYVNIPLENLKTIYSLMEGYDE